MSVTIKNPTLVIIAIALGAILNPLNTTMITVALSSIQQAGHVIRNESKSEEGTMVKKRTSHNALGHYGLFFWGKGVSKTNGVDLMCQ